MIGFVKLMKTSSEIRIGALPLSWILTSLVLTDLPIDIVFRSINEFFWNSLS